MTIKETGEVLAILKANWPSFYKDIARDELKAVVNVWAGSFANEPASEVFAAVKTIIKSSTSGFPPTIGQVWNQLQKLRYPDAMTEQEAWALVVRACKKLDPTAPSREFNKLPPPIQAAVGSTEVLFQWAFETDIAAFNSVVASNFQRSYRVAKQREWDDALALPGRSSRAMIGQGRNDEPW